MLRRRVVRPVLVGAAAFLVTLGPMTAARSQEGGTPTPLRSSQEAYYTNRIASGLPPVLVKQFPPAPVCLVAPAQVCGPEVDALKTTLGLNAGVPVPDVPDFQLPQPVQPGTVPIGMFGGATRYTAALKFTLPSIPDNALVEKFDLVLNEGDLTFSIESPAFRGAVLAGLSQYPEQRPEVLQAYLEGVASGTPALAAFEPTGIEACLIRGTWTAGPSQDPATKPQADCVTGGTGVRDTANGTWTFDISPIVQAWVDGAPNEGIYFGPLGAQNVAYGDPDPSTNFVVSLVTTADEAQAPTAVVAIGEKPPELEDLSPSGALGDSLGTDSGVVDNVNTFSAPLSSASSGSGASSDVPTVNEVAASQNTAAGGAKTPWWIWLVIPILAAGCYALAQSFDATPTLATRRAGAMTRLVQARQSGRFPSAGSS